MLETYERILLKIAKDGKADIVKKLFEWIAAAERPLNLFELREAIAIYPGQPYSMPNRQVNDKEAIIPWCRSLVSIDEDGQIVQFAHHTIKSFLTSFSVAQSGEFRIDLDKTHDSIGEICCTYLAFNDFKRELIHLDNTEFNLAPKTLVSNTLSTNRMAFISKTWSALEKPRRAQPANGKNVDVYRRLQILALDKGFNSLPELQERHQFLAYASQFWISHTRRISSESIVYRVWKNLLFGSEMHGAKAWTYEEIQAGEERIIKCIMDIKHIALLKLFLDVCKDRQQLTIIPKLWK